MSGYIVRGTGKRTRRTLWSAEDEVCCQALPVRDLASEYDSLESASAAAERMRIDGGRRLWDHNPNCREQARMRYYAGFEGDELRARFGAAERGGR